MNSGIGRILLLGGVVAAAIMLIVIVAISSRTSSAVPEAGAGTNPDELSESQAFAVVRAALSVRNQDEVSESTFPGSVSGERIVEYMKNLPATDGELVRLEWLSSVRANHRTMEGVTVVFNKDGQNRNRLALLWRDGDGPWKMDFEAFARWTEPGWDAIRGGHGGSIMVRVFCGPDNYYNGPFRDDRRWRCFGLASPDVGDLMFAYCERGSRQDRALRSLFEEARGPIRVVLRIRSQEGGESRQFVIEQVVSDDWARGPVPYEDL